MVWGHCKFTVSLLFWLLDTKSPSLFCFPFPITPPISNSLAATSPWKLESPPHPCQLHSPSYPQRLQQMMFPLTLLCPSPLFFFIYLFIYLWLCWVFTSERGLSSSCGKRGPLFIAMRGPLTIAASLAAEHRLQTRRLSNCGSRAQLLRGMWDLPRPGLEPVSPALADRLSATAPPGKPLTPFLMLTWAHLHSFFPTSF